MTKTATKKATYKAELLTFGKKYSASAISVEKAIEKLEPGNIQGRGILTISYGKEKKERIIPAVRMKRLFNTRGLARELEIKNVSLMYQGL